MHNTETTIEWPAGGERVFDAVVGGVEGTLGLLLTPAELAFGAIVEARNRGYDTGLLKAHRVSVPVISVGNVVAGGAGKTPVTRWLTGELLRRGRHPAILHGGYGADEPRLHEVWHPGVIVIAERDRVAAAQQAIAQGADVILLDDAFQHRRLARDLDVVLLPAEVSNRRLLPRGPAREPWHALRRADFLLIMRKTAPGPAAAALEEATRAAVPDVPTARAYLKLAVQTSASATIAVAAIARPDLFLRQLLEAGVAVERMLAYPDHHEFTDNDVAYIRTVARTLPVVTTAKDAVKLQPLMPRELMIAEQELVFESGREALVAALDRLL